LCHDRYLTISLRIEQDRKLHEPATGQYCRQNTYCAFPFGWRGISVRGMIAQTIQLALAPVFVLVALGNIMNILSTRLGRVVDRSRHLQDRHMATTGSEHDMIVTEIRSIDRRIALITQAIRLLVISGLAIGTTVAILFMEEIAQLHLQQVAAASLRIPRDYLELHRDL